VYGEPIAHLIGQRDFWDMTLKVTKDTLIPRPETERLVQLALAQIPADAAWHIADLGTGSGAIALAIARERPHCQLLATDLSAQALAVARDNAQQLQVTNIRFQNSHWFAQLAGSRFEMIVSNPPYIAPDDPHLSQGDLRFEPQSALRADSGGLADIRAITQQAREHLTPPGWLLLEHGYQQGAAVAALLNDLGYREVEIYQDLNGNDRITLGKWDSEIK
jgi:release factor glutamine methyltransferase